MNFGCEGVTKILIIMKSKNAPEINAGSMADIAFLLLVFFLVTTTMDSEFGMMRKLPSLDEVDHAKVLQRNVMDIWINSENEIMMEGEKVLLSDVTNVAKAFILNQDNEVNMPEMKPVNVALFGDVLVSKQVISLQNDKNTSYGVYLQVQNELSRAYNELRDELAMLKFGLDYQGLKEQNQLVAYNSIKTIYPQRISEAEPMNAEEED